MGTDNVIFLENLEWFDDSGKELVHRIPEKGSPSPRASRLFGARATCSCLTHGARRGKRRV